MQVEQRKWSPESGWQAISSTQLKDKAQLVFAFGNESTIKLQDRYDELRQQYPTADIISCCTDGEILNDDILEDNIIVSALAFSSTQIQPIAISLADVKDSFDAGAHLSADLDKDTLDSLLLFADSQYVLGTDLITGIHINLASQVPILGGMTKGAVGLNSLPKDGQVIGVGFSGKNLEIGYSVDNAWTTLGAEKVITRVENHRVYEIEEKPALNFYKEYLEGVVERVEDHILRFPLGIRAKEQEQRIIRSMVEVHDDGSISYAGSLRNGDQIRMMKSSHHKLMLAAERASEQGINSISNPPQFILLFNCDGRRKILKDWIREELDGMKSKFDSSIPLMGFYTHGEICPITKNTKSQLHNQTVVFNTISETE